MKGDLCTRWWDTKPFVHHLACVRYGLENFAKYKQICIDMHNTQSDLDKITGQVRSDRPPPQISIQARAREAIIAWDGGFDFYPLLLRRSSPLGLPNTAVISRSDVCRALRCAAKISHVDAMA